MPSVFDDIDKKKEEHVSMKTRVAAFRGFRFIGRKRDGTWQARQHSGERAWWVEAKTSKLLVERIALEFCQCGHRWLKHDHNGCCGRVGKGAVAECPCETPRPEDVGSYAIRRPKPLAHVQQDLLAKVAP
jgi:hypothetical protein